MKIEDFGEKIGGARKNVWKLRGLQVLDLEEMNTLEKTKFITKNNVWLKPDYQKMIDEGLSKRLVYFIKLVRDSLPTKPVTTSNIEMEETQENYVDVISQLKSTIMSLKDEKDILSYYQDYINDIYVHKTSSRLVNVDDKARGIVNNKFLKAVQHSDFFNIDREIARKKFYFGEEELMLAPYQFYKYSKDYFEFDNREDRTAIFMRKGYSTHIFYPATKFSNQDNYKEDTIIVCKRNEIIDINQPSIEEAKHKIVEALKPTLLESKNEESKDKNKNSKNRFIPSQLEHINRNGFSYRNDRNVRNQDFLDVFNFKGGEFGNWLNDKDRQASLNFAFDAFLDLAVALNIHPSSVAFHSELSIAFGSRGVGSALAHYEPLRDVINLTKMKGAGSLAHEWGHALDNRLGKHFGLEGFASNYPRKIPLIKELMDVMKYDENNKKTNFYEDSIEFDKNHTKTTHGYWSSNVELFARAFACYVDDKLLYTSDYLTGHANSVSSGNLCAYPVGIERERINLQFDKLLEFTKEVEIMHVLSEKEIDSVQKRFEHSIDKDKVLGSEIISTSEQMVLDFDDIEEELEI